MSIILIEVAVLTAFSRLAWSGTYRHYFNSAIRTKKQNKALLTNDISSGGSDITFYSERM